MSVQQAWVVRGGRNGERDHWALENNLVGIGFSEIPDLRAYGTRDQIQQLVREELRDIADQAVANYAAQLFAFARRIQIGDWVLLPIKGTQSIALGKITSGYKYDAEQPDRKKRHFREVEWLNQELPRTAIHQDLLHSIGAFLTVFQLTRNDAVWRVGQIASTGTDPGSRVQTVGKNQQKTPSVPLSNDDQLEVATLESGIDVDRYTKDQISARIREVYAGHDLAKLVAAILTAEGFRCTVSDPGADGGVDIIAGSGFLGMDSPRVIVQVKSESTPVGDPVVSQLNGALNRNKADQGLLVAMGGITRQAKNWLQGQAFTIAVWDSDKLIEEVMNHYHDLPEDIQQKLPLAKTWYLTNEMS